jgi:hypothetical protein
MGEFWFASVLSGTDPSRSHAIGSPFINGTVVMQLAGGFLDGVTYRVQATATTSANQVLRPWANIFCTGDN